MGIACSIVLELVGSWALQLLFGSSIDRTSIFCSPSSIHDTDGFSLVFRGFVDSTLRNFKANFIGNIVALVSVLAVTFPFVNLWDMNGVSFAGAVACLAGVVLGRLAVRAVRAAATGSAQA